MEVREEWFAWIVMLTKSVDTNLQSNRMSIKVLARDIFPVDL